MAKTSDERLIALLDAQAEAAEKYRQWVEKTLHAASLAMRWRRIVRRKGAAVRRRERELRSEAARKANETRQRRHVESEENSAAQREEFPSPHLTDPNWP